MGLVAVIWTVDCFVDLYLTLPRRGTFLKKWRRAWVVLWQGGAYRLNFDLHRAGALWLWLLLLALAVSSVSLNLRTEVFQPLVNLFSPVTQTAWDLREPGNGPAETRLSFAVALARGKEEAARLGWEGRVESVRYIGGYDILTVQFRFEGPLREEWRYLHLDGQDGRLLEGEFLGQGSAGDIFTQAQFPVHSGRLLGLPGRILIAIAGVVTCLLAATGIYIWWKKRIRASVPASGRRGTARCPRPSAPSR